MEPTEATPIFFTDRFVHSMDEKGRVTLPAQYRRFFPSDSIAYFMPSAHGEPCIRVFPVETWTEWDKKYMEPQDELDEATSRGIRKLYSRIKTVTVDKAGRVLLPEYFVNALTLAGKVKMVGHRDHFEIWDPEEFDRFMEDEYGAEES